MAITSINVPTDDGIYWSKNPIIVQLQTDVDLSVNPETKIKLRIDLTIGATTQQAILEMVPDADGYVIFDIALLVDSCFTNAATNKDLELSPTIYTNIRFLVFMEAFEWFGSPLAEESLTTITTNCYVFKGGIPWQENYMQNYFGIYFTEATYKPFLTNHPVAKKVFRNQKEYLSFINIDASDLTISLVVKVYAEDESEVDSFEMYNPVSIDASSVISFPVGFRNFFTDAGWAAYTPAALYYTVHIKRISDDAIISETRKFYVRDKYYAHTRYFIFENSLAGSDTIAFTGERVKKVKYKSNSAERYVAPDYYPTYTSQRISYGLREQVSYKISSGVITKAEMDWLREMFLAEEIGEIINGRYYPIEIISESIEMKEDGNQLFSVSFEYQPRYSNNVYSSQQFQLIL